MASKNEVATFKAYSTRYLGRISQLDQIPSRSILNRVFLPGCHLLLKCSELVLLQVLRLEKEYKNQRTARKVNDCVNERQP